MKDSQKPIARKTNLVIQELPGEVLVYDLETDKAHCLNNTAAAIWKSCDGNNSVAEITRILTGANGDGAHEDLVWLAIDQLNENNLLEKKIPTNFHNQNRREVIKKIGLSAVIALPLISSLVAPKAAQAGSVCQNIQCTSNADCASGCAGCQPTGNGGSTCL